VAQSMPIAAANEGGTASVGVGLGAGLAMGQQMMNAMRPTSPAPASGAAPVATEGTKFCINCGKPMVKIAKFCSECGSAQQ
jgi:membrane protease subunit (stomatin/prohibitin family)